MHEESESFGALRIYQIPPTDLDYNSSCNFCPARSVSRLFAISGTSVAVRMCAFCLKKIVDEAVRMKIPKESMDLQADMETLTAQRDEARVEIAMLEWVVRWIYASPEVEQALAPIKEQRNHSELVRATLYLKNVLDSRRSAVLTLQQTTEKLQREKQVLRRERDHYRDMYFNQIQNTSNRETWTVTNTTEPTAGYVNQDDFEKKKSKKKKK